jgi:GT2 family glycosyltransferase
MAPPVTPPEPPPTPPPPFPKVSVVILSRNTVAALRHTLEALRKSQGREQIEIFVVDLASGDGSERLDSEMPDVTVLRLARHFGRTRARNIAIRSATGEFLLFLEPGVELAADSVEQMAKLLAGSPDAAAVAPPLVSPEGKPIPSAYRLPSPAGLADACKTGTELPMTEPGATAEAVSDDVLLVRRVFVAGMNYFDEKRYAQWGAGLDLFRQIRNAGKKVRIAPAARATVHAVEPYDRSPAATALRQADRILGATAWVARAYGPWAGIAFRTKLTFGALFGSLSVFWHLVTGQRIDGTQTDAYQ